MFLFLHDLLDSVAEVFRIVDDNQPLVISFEHAARVRAGGQASSPDPGGRDGDIRLLTKRAGLISRSSYCLCSTVDT